jgi:hypothetical protein
VEQSSPVGQLSVYAGLDHPVCVARLRARSDWEREKCHREKVSR